MDVLFAKSDLFYDDFMNIIMVIALFT